MARQPRAVEAVAHGEAPPAPASPPACSLVRRDRATAVRWRAARTPRRPAPGIRESAVDVRQGYRAQDWQRLRTVRGQVDPLGTIVADHAVPPAAAEAPAER